MLSLLGDIGDVTFDAGPTILHVITDVQSDAAKLNAKRIGKSGRKRKEDVALPSNKLKKPTHGTGSFIVNKELCVEEATATSALVRDHGFSFLRAGGGDASCSQRERYFPSREHTPRALEDCIRQRMRRSRAATKRRSSIAFEIRDGFR